jgi:hypothetical protein
MPGARPANGQYVDYVLYGMYIASAVISWGSFPVILAAGRACAAHARIPEPGVDHPPGAAASGFPRAAWHRVLRCEYEHA